MLNQTICVAKDHLLIVGAGGIVWNMALDNRTLRCCGIPIDSEGREQGALLARQVAYSADYSVALATYSVGPLPEPAAFERIMKKHPNLQSTIVVMSGSPDDARICCVPWPWTDCDPCGILYWRDTFWISTVDRDPVRPNVEHALVTLIKDEQEWHWTNTGRPPTLPPFGPYVMPMLSPLMCHSHDGMAVYDLYQRSIVWISTDRVLKERLPHNDFHLLLGPRDTAGIVLLESDGVSGSLSELHPGGCRTELRRWTRVPWGSKAAGVAVCAGDTVVVLDAHQERLFMSRLSCDSWEPIALGKVKDAVAWAHEHIYSGPL